MSILGLDYGKKNIGVALSQSGIVAQGLGRLQNQGGPEIEELREICQKHQVNKIVLGLPKSLHDMAEGPMSKTVKEYGQKLEKELSLPVYYEDETLTSNEAESNLRGLGWDSAKIEAKIDEESAKVILESFLERT